MLQPPKQNSNDIDPDITPNPDEARVNQLFFAIVLVAITIIAIHCGIVNMQSPAVALLWVMACLAVGAGIGFLFGLTRVGQTQRKENQDGKDSDETYKPQINTNLIEISDWLTKIIVGLGLINLKEIPTKLRHVAEVLGGCLGGSCGIALALAIIVGFSILGFLFGYLNTRTLIARMLDAADRHLLRKVKKLEERLELAKSDAVRQAEGVVAETQAQASETSRTNVPPLVEGVEVPNIQVVLDKMAEDYQKIESPDYRVRVQLKDKAASDMLRHILKNKISKQVITEWASTNPSDGRIVALAAYVLAYPEPGDLARLLSVAKSAVWLHVKYRVTLALRQLCQRDLGQPNEWKQALEVIALYRAHAERRKDFSLLTLTEELQILLKDKLK